MNILLKNRQCPGDILMLSGAVRDLHAAYPGQYRVGVQTSCMDLWKNNPLVVTDPQALGKPDRVIECAYPLIQWSNQRPVHFSQGFAQHLGWRLGVEVRTRSFAGDIYLSEEEKAPPPLLGERSRYWIVMAGGKFDVTTKWWPPQNYQAVVDHFGGRVHFVQCGQECHWHPPLNGVTNLVGKTTLREFVRLMYRADGVLCPITFAMHLSAAVPLRPGQLSRACVVVAGGREPPHWEQYPSHQYLHTIGALECCAAGGCWVNRCQTVDDGDARNQRLCSKPVAVSPGLNIPKCMTLVTPSRVIAAIELYYAGGVLSYPEAQAA